MSKFLKSFSSSQQRNSDVQEYNSKRGNSGSNIKNFFTRKQDSKTDLSDLISSKLKQNICTDSRNHTEISNNGLNPYTEGISFQKPARPGSFSNSNEIQSLREENQALREKIQEMHEEKVQLKNNLKINKEVIQSLINGQEDKEPQQTSIKEQIMEKLAEAPQGSKRPVPGLNLQSLKHVKEYGQPENKD